MQRFELKAARDARRAKQIVRKAKAKPADARLVKAARRAMAEMSR